MKKTKRVGLSLTPTLHQYLLNKASKRGFSLSSYINSLLLLEQKHEESQRQEIYQMIKQIAKKDKK